MNELKLEKNSRILVLADNGGETAILAEKRFREGHRIEYIDTNLLIALWYKYMFNIDTFDTYNVDYYMKILEKASIKGSSEYKKYKSNQIFTDDSSKYFKAIYGLITKKRYIDYIYCLDAIPVADLNVLSSKVLALCVLNTIVNEEKTLKKITTSINNNIKLFREKQKQIFNHEGLGLTSVFSVFYGDPLVLRSGAGISQTSLFMFSMIGGVRASENQMYMPSTIGTGSANMKGKWLSVDNPRGPYDTCFDLICFDLPLYSNYLLYKERYKILSAIFGDVQDPIHLSDKTYEQFKDDTVEKINGVHKYLKNDTYLEVYIKYDDYVSERHIDTIISSVSDYYSIEIERDTEEKPIRLRMMKK